MHSEMPEIIYMNEGRELVIPCRVTSPAISVTLKKVKLSSAARNPSSANERNERSGIPCLGNGFLTDVWAPDFLQPPFTMMRQVLEITPKRVFKWNKMIIS